MQIVIDIHEDLYKSIICHRCKIAFQQKCDYEYLKNAIEDGTPLPEGHGRLIDADNLKTAFPSGEYVRTECVRATIDHEDTIIEADKAESEEV